MVSGLSFPYIFVFLHRSCLDKYYTFSIVQLLLYVPWGTQKITLCVYGFTGFQGNPYVVFKFSILVHWSTFPCFTVCKNVTLYLYGILKSKFSFQFLRNRNDGPNSTHLKDILRQLWNWLPWSLSFLFFSGIKVVIKIYFMEEKEKQLYFLSPYRAMDPFITITEVTWS